ncbi:MAG TPA: 2-hydroxyacyl-CoA dehydratase family protein [Bacteroidia bacterium]|nr:2-hydroxyacyl-CoA dehydratase family protein [Bacteroidia bacterium]
MAEIKSISALKNVMKNYFKRLDTAPLVAWCTSVGPAEILRSFGFEVYFPENHGALLGATKQAEEKINYAVKKGYSPHICSYTTADIGSYLSGHTPLSDHYGIKGIPKPSLIVYNTNQCREVQDWFNFFGEEFNCPTIGIYPPRHLDEIGKEDIEQVKKQFLKLIQFCENVTGKKYDEESFKNVVKLSKEATLLWQKVLKTAAHSPSPITFFDGVILMGPIVVLRGTEEAKNLYAQILEELKSHIQNGMSAVPNEKIRIFWDGMPLWGRLRMLADLFRDNNTAIVASTYCNSWIFDEFDENNPLESTALAYTKIFINRSEKVKTQMLLNWAKEYNVDGIIFHDTKTCFNNSNAKFGLPQKIQEKYHIPTLIIEGDLCDMRMFSEGQSITKIETFLEQIGDIKKQLHEPVK